MARFAGRGCSWLIPALCLWAWGGAVIVMVSPDEEHGSLAVNRPSTGPTPRVPSVSGDGVAETANSRPRVPYYAGRLFTVNSRFHPLIEAVSATHDVDQALVKAIVQAESAFDSDAISKEGALGLMQVLPTTASRYAVHDLSDPHQNLQAGVQHLKRLLMMFKGDVALALAAYNAGENAVKRFNGIPPYEETLAYVGKVLGLWKLYARPVLRKPSATLLTQSEAGISG